MMPEIHCFIHIPYNWVIGILNIVEQYFYINTSIITKAQNCYNVCATVIELLGICSEYFIC